MYRKLIVLFGCAAAIAQPVAAQSVPTPLKVLIEDADEDSHACGVTDELMAASLRSALRYNRIAEYKGDELGHSLAYLSVTTMQANGLCISNVDFAIKKYAYADAPGMDQRVYADVVYCNKGSMLSGSDHGARVGQKINELVDGCISGLMLED